MRRNSEWRWLVLTILAFLGARSSAPQTLDLSQQEHEQMSKYFGDALRVNAIEAHPIDDPRAYLKPEDGSQWAYRLTHGHRRGKFGVATLHRSAAGGQEADWRFDLGSSSVLHTRHLDDGSVVIHAAEDRKNKVISRYDPPEPLMLSGLEPGESRKVKLSVKVYDLDRPDHLTHEGSLDVDYTYVGAFEVTVPAGTFETVLLRWDYDGTVGAASVKDVQYWFLAKERGPVAMIEKSDISAFLFYQDHKKDAAVLVE